MGISLAPQLLPYNILLNQIFTETFAENNSLAASEISSPANTSLWKSCDKQLGHPQRGSHPRLSYKAHEPFQNHIFTNYTNFSGLGLLRPPAFQEILNPVKFTQIP